MGMIQKQEHFFTRDELHQRQNRKDLWQRNVMGGGEESGSSTATQRVNNRGVSPAMHQLQRSNTAHAVYVWYDQLGVMCFELPQANETITEERCKQTVDAIDPRIEAQHSQYATRNNKVISQYDNSRPHVAKIVK